uniref:Uncharacterized protein n=1 Tax=Aegilops tauschii subsp. strangulata TaxID=200361 RepID=A0A453RA15_AEGTS
MPSTALIFKPKPRRTLSPPRRWKLLFNEEGCLDAAGMIMRVQRGSGYFKHILGYGLDDWLQGVVYDAYATTAIFMHCFTYLIFTKDCLYFSV